MATVQAAQGEVAAAQAALASAEDRVRATEAADKQRLVHGALLSLLLCIRSVLMHVESVAELMQMIQSKVHACCWSSSCNDAHHPHRDGDVRPSYHFSLVPSGETSIAHLLAQPKASSSPCRV